MYKKIPLGFLSVLLTVFFYTSCTKPDITFGESYLSNSFTNIVSVDTATSLISTVFIDSFITSATTRAVVGTYNDPYFGAVSAQSYFPLSPPAFSDIYTNSIYDSLELILKLNKRFYGDTTKPLQISVNQLSQVIQYAENKTVLYNVNSVPAEQVALGTKTILIRPSVTDTVSIRLNDVLGKQLLEKFRTGSGDVTSSGTFTEYFKGIRISSSGTPAFILGFSDSVIMRLHYRDPGVIIQNKNIDFTISDYKLQFNHISINRSSTPLSSLNATNSEIPSSATNNMSFLQSATGSVIKISFPYIRNFLQNNQFVKVVKAQLVVRPINNSFNGFFPLPPQLTLSQTSSSNEFGPDIKSDSSTSAVILTGNLSFDPLYGLNTGYTYDITNYIVGQMAVAGANKNGLLLSPPAADYPSDFNRLVIGDKNNTNGNIQLKLYYLTVAK